MVGLIAAYVRFTLTTVSVSLGPREARINLIANNVASWGIYIPLAYIMPITWKWGLPGFWWSDCCGEAFKVACLYYAVSNVDWEKAASDARGKAMAANEDTAECEQLEKQAYSSLVAYASPSPSAATANLALHSPNLMTGRQAQDFKWAASSWASNSNTWAANSNLSNKDQIFRRTPSTNFVHIDTL